MDQPISREEARVADALPKSWVYSLTPVFVWPYLQLMRADRPIGAYLLFWPAAWSVALANLSFGVPSPPNLWSIVLLYIGAVVMRGAGCVWNDITDRHLDAQVERTRSRPLPSGRVSVRQALVFMMVLALIGFLVLWQFNLYTVLLGLASLPIVLLYPFMKRVTFFPQIVLGLAFNWGALVGWASETGSLGWPPILLYLGGIFWTLGYDTIYAHQDKEDDALIGVKSTALKFGRHSRALIALFFALTVVLVGLAAAPFEPHLMMWLGLALFAAHFAYQIVTLNIDDPDKCLTLFRANHSAGALLFLALCAGAL